MTNTHNLEGNEGAYSLHTPHPHEPRGVGEGKSLMEKVPAPVSREKTCFCCEKEPERSVQGKVERRSLLSRTSALLGPVGVPYKEAKCPAWSGTELERKRGGQGWITGGQEAVPEEAGG